MDFFFKIGNAGIFNSKPDVSNFKEMQNFPEMEIPALYCFITQY